MKGCMFVATSCSSSLQIFVQSTAKTPHRTNCHFGPVLDDVALDGLGVGDADWGPGGYAQKFSA